MSETGMKRDESISAYLYQWKSNNDKYFLDNCFSAVFYIFRMKHRLRTRVRSIVQRASSRGIIDRNVDRWFTL